MPVQFWNVGVGLGHGADATSPAHFKRGRLRPGEELGLLGARAERLEPVL